MRIYIYKYNTHLSVYVHGAVAEIAIDDRPSGLFYDGGFLRYDEW